MSAKPACKECEVREAEADTAFEPASAPQPKKRDERVLSLCEGMIDIAAALFSVSGRELRRGGRRSLPVARVRQIAMYVAHTVLGLSMKEVGRGFGRDRTTVLHACHLVEDMRDEEEFDRHVVLTERVAMAAFRDRLER
ncbi:chromosomal replication initiator DnaA [Mesorhizobium sp. RP14(2022)]|uniref:Chromosomal replication initiator DnaA n=1 Tax=Mesorhizobium liriopis TaxID=2953882 RepID=A0ABT1C1B3_9HYPH|nr:chromosomal replication initiator DnaA [Mesorhizobium liriopis]